MKRVVLEEPRSWSSRPSCVLVVVLALAPGRAALAVHVYVLVLLAAALASMVGSIAAQAHTGDSPFDAALRRPAEESERLPELTRLEREVGLAQATEFDLHHRLRPVLREIAMGLLFVRRGVGSRPATGTRAPTARRRDVRARQCGPGTALGPAGRRPHARRAPGRGGPAGGA